MSGTPAAELPEGWPKVPLAMANAALAAPESPVAVSDGVVLGNPMKVYTHAPKNLRELFEVGRAFADRDFIVYEDERVTFDAHAKAVEHMAGIFIEQYGIQKGDRIAIIMRNYPQWSVAFFAGLMIGAIVTPMNSWWTGEELEYGLSDSGSKLAVVDPQLLKRILPHLGNLPALKNIIVARDDDPNRADPKIKSMESLIGNANSWAGLQAIGLPPVDIEPDDESTIMYSSGTTGQPKGVLGTHRGIVSNMFNALTTRARRFVRAGEPVPEPDPDPDAATKVLLSVPFFHATGAFAVLIPTWATGGKIVCMYKWVVEEALPIIEREKITAIGGVPAIAWQVIEHPDRDKYDLSTINAVSYGGAPSAPELVSSIKATFKDAHAGNGWGMTETSATATQNFGEDYVNRPSSAGCPVAAVELKLCDPDGNEVPEGEVGELWVKGPMNAKEYWNKPEATATTFIDGWVVTGDLARIDEEGFLYIVDRAKDMLIRGGENVYCIEVENALYEHPAIMDAAVVGIQHKVLGEEVGAVCQIAPGHDITQEELQDFVRPHIAAFKVPVEIQFQTDPLPRNANGKVLKNVLREQFDPRG